MFQLLAKLNFFEYSYSRPLLYFGLGLVGVLVVVMFLGRKIRR